MRVIVTFLMGVLFFFAVMLFINNTQLQEEVNDLETSSSSKEGDNIGSRDLENVEKDSDKKTHQVNEGVHLWIGKSGDDLDATYGEPNRRDPTPYGYDWWIYNEMGIYLQFGVSYSDNLIVSVFTNDEHAQLPLFQIGDSYEKVSGLFELKDVISLKGNYSSYQFELKEEELKMYPLSHVDDIWVQFYFDVIEDSLSSVRFLDQKTLLLQRPYSVVYRGELPEITPLSEEQWKKIQRGQEKQIFDLTNDLRIKHGLDPLQWEETTAQVALLHSKDMHYNNYFSHTSPSHGELKDRLQAEYVSFQVAAENIAANYVDGIAAVEGWLNSEGHRVNLLNERFTHLGVGVYRSYYTQNFLTPW